MLPPAGPRAPALASASPARLPAPYPRGCRAPRPGHGAGLMVPFHWGPISGKTAFSWTGGRRRMVSGLIRVLYSLYSLWPHFPGGSDGKGYTSGRRRRGFHLWARKIPRKTAPPPQYSHLGNSMRRGSPVLPQSRGNKGCALSDQRFPLRLLLLPQLRSSSGIRLPPAPTPLNLHLLRKQVGS